MIKIPIAALVPLARDVLKYLFGKPAKERNVDALVKKIRRLENDMEMLRVGSPRYKSLRRKWLRLSRKHADIAGRGRHDT